MFVVCDVPVTTTAVVVIVIAATTAAVVDANVAAAAAATAAVATVITLPSLACTLDLELVHCRSLSRQQPDARVRDTTSSPPMSLACCSPLPL